VPGGERVERSENGRPEAQREKEGAGVIERPDWASAWRKGRGEKKLHGLLKCDMAVSWKPELEAGDDDSWEGEKGG